MGSKYRSVVAKAGQVIRSRGISETSKWVEELTDQNKSWENTEVEIGILGESHRGKSTFINTIRGLKPGDPESAEVDYKECTTDVKSYIFPNNPNIKLVDCPGVGTDKFKRETYHQQIDFKRFNFCVILSKDSFTENDTWLATQLRESGIKFFFARTFMEETVRGAMRNKNVEFKTNDGHGNSTKELEIFENQVMQEVKAYCHKKLDASQNGDAKIYLISNHFPEKFEFTKLILELQNHLPDIQKEALIFSIKNFFLENIKEKKSLLQKRIKNISTLSRIAGTNPIPLLSFSANIPLIMGELNFYKEQFQIDNENYSHGNISKKAYNKQVLACMAKFGTQTLVATALEKFTNITPVKEAVKAIIDEFTPTAVNAAIGGALSFVATYHFLSTELDNLEKLAEEALNKHFNEESKRC